jgi:hypothetical protein
VVAPDLVGVDELLGGMTARISVSIASSSVGPNGIGSTKPRLSRMASSLASTSTKIGA